MEHEIRYYLKQIKEALQDEKCEFKPSYMITAIKLPTGAIELVVNNDKIEEKIDYILESYDNDMHLISNPEIVMQNLMVV